MVRFQAFIDQLLIDKNSICILEAGCGSISYLHFKQKHYIVGIDISEKQLQRNSRLNEKILGDIQYYDFQSSVFDVVVCWNVLEHLTKPDLALLKFVYALKEDGIIILAIPNVLSLKGLVTKYTPLWFHTFYYRNLLGKKHKGKDDFGPYKTYLRLSISPSRINKFSTRSGLKVLYFDSYNPDWGESIRLVKNIYIGLVNLMKLTSLNKLGNSEILMILQKNHRSTT